MKLITLVPFLIISTDALSAEPVLNFSPDTFTVNTSLGVLNGESKEFVYDSGSKLSQLTWKIKNTPIIKAGMSWDAHPHVTLSASGWTTLASASSGMEDLDWLSPGQSHWSDRSVHPATRLNEANSYDLNATGWLLKESDWRLGMMAGWQQTRFSWLATGGSYNYDNGQNTGDFARGKRGIGYRQTFSVPYMGLSGSYRYQDVDFTALFKFSPWAKGKDNDEHYARGLNFTDNGKHGKYYSATLSSGWYVTPNARLFAEVTWSRFSQIKASSRVYEYSTGESDHSDSDSAGLQNYTLDYSAGIQYRF